MPMSLRVAVVMLVLISAAPVFAQDRAAGGHFDKRLLVAESMWLTESEATGFWPIYEAYQQDLDRIYDRIGKVILEYVRAHIDNALTDEQARALTDQAVGIDEAETALAKTYAVKLDAVLPGKKVARYLQIERHIGATLRYELADKIPLVN